MINYPRVRIGASLFSGLLLACGLVLLGSSSSVQAGEKQSLFSGKDLQGWEGDSKLWSVLDGQIVGTTVDNKIKANTFLVWQGETVQNFRLTLQARLEGDNNSGVQYRSELKDPKTWRVVGYQMDLHAKPEYTAMLYSEGTGRGILAERGQKATLETKSEDTVLEKNAFELKPIDISKWHEYTILAQGNHLIHQLDGKTTINVTDKHQKKRDRGIIALQLHAGAPMTVYFKDIVLERF